MKRSACVVAAGVIALSTAATATGQPNPPPPPPPTPALERPMVLDAPDTHITGIGRVQTIDCSGGTLFLNGSNNVINALGTCFAVTVQGSGNTVVAETVLNDITVYGWDQTVLFKSGEPLITDIGRQLQMTNRIDRIPA